MRRLRFRIIAALLIVVLVLGGCASPTPTTPATPPPSPAAPAPTSIPPTPTPTQPTPTPATPAPAQPTPAPPTPEPTPTPTPPPSPPAVPALPTLVITSPLNGASLAAGNITVTTQATNFNIVDKQGQANVAGEGHLHFYLDVDAPTTAGQPAVPTSGVWAHVSGSTYTFTNVAPGTHNISVEMVNNDHTPVIPAVVVKIIVTVTAGNPVIPNPPAPYPYSITITNFAFSPESLTVPVGANVTWTNQDSYSHAISGSGGTFNSGTLGFNASFSYVFSNPGTYTYSCSIHPYMTGTIVVK